MVCQPFLSRLQRAYATQRQCQLPLVLYLRLDLPQIIRCLVSLRLSKSVSHPLG